MIVAVFMCSLFALGARSVKASEVISADQNTSVQTKLHTAIRNEGFSGSILVVHQGGVTLNREFGFANYSFNQPNTPQTVFRIGSITKQSQRRTHTFGRNGMRRMDVGPPSLGQSPRWTVVGYTEAR